MSADFTPPRPSFLVGDRGSFSSLESSDSDSAPQTQRLAGNTRRSRRRLSQEHWESPQDFPRSPTSATPMVTMVSPTSPSVSFSSRVPPSSFRAGILPFQSHAGNPDPIGPSSRRNSADSLNSAAGGGHSQSSHTQPISPSTDNVHVPAVTGMMTPNASARNLPRTSSNASFRAPFLSPNSRPGSIWSPPSFPYLNAGQDTPAASSTALASAMAKGKPLAASTRLPEKLTKEEKPWLMKNGGRSRASYWLTVMGILIGVGCAAIIVWRKIADVRLLKDSDLCEVLSEDWSNGISDDVWVRDAELGGFGNGEFQACTTEDKNAYIRDNQLYIMPTLMSDDISRDDILDGYTYTVDGCTSSNKTACSIKSNSKTYTVVNPVKSARLTTKGKKTIKYGKVEVRAKLPRGDWLWPAIWMLPNSDDPYGKWPIGGEIDIMEARGNGPEYGAQGVNYVRSSLNYGPLQSLVTKIYGWWQVKRSSYADDFHTYTMEWSKDWMRFYVDTRLHAMLDLTVKKESDSFWERGDFPATAQNGSTEVVVKTPYGYGTYMAPFDQDFYLILNVAVGGTSGWFPDDIGDKPWYDGSDRAMTDFAKAQDTWSATWPSSEDQRAFRIDSVKMWKLKDGGSC